MREQKRRRVISGNEGTYEEGGYHRERANR
jgi:hypothetical protein